MIFRLLS